MAGTIDSRLNNAADALFHVVGDIMETGSTEIMNLTKLFEDIALGKFHPSKTVVKTLFQKFIALKEFQVYHLEMLQEYLEGLDLTNVTDEKQKKWWTLFHDRAMNTDIDSIVNKSTTAVQKSKEEDHAQAMASHRLSSNVKIPTYDGTFGGASDFVFKFKNSMKFCRFPSRDHFSIFHQHVTGNAYECVARDMDVYGDDLDQYFNRLIADFDHFDVDDETDKFMNKFRQNQNEPTRIFRQRFNLRMDRLIMLGRMCSFKDDPERHNGEQSLFFYQKLNNTV